MKRTGFIILFFSLVSSILLAQPNFDRDAASFHKKAIMLCAAVKNPTPDVKHIDSLLTNTTTALLSLAGTYQYHPPVEYQGDPLWSSYFVDWADNLLLVKTFIAERNFSLVQKYCNTFCRIFVRLHENNDRVDLTDLVFTMNLSIKAGQEMANANNMELAQKKADEVEKIMNQIEAMTKNSTNTSFMQDFVKIKPYTVNWVKAIRDKNPVWAKTMYAMFMKNYVTLFLASL
ncbi:MAG: hypothetical protein ACP5F6_05830 [Microbacter sp.]